VLNSAEGGSLGFSFGGGVNLNGFADGGYGGGDGNGDGAESGQTIVVNLTSSGISHTFTAAAAGVKLDACIWTAIKGSIPYALPYTGSNTNQSPYPITATNIASGSTTLATKPTIPYDSTTLNIVAAVPGSRSWPPAPGRCRGGLGLEPTTLEAP
jgi:hypothetical protein